MCLGRCLEVLKANQAAPSGAPQRVLPYRESKITHLFKDALHGWGHLVLAVSASPSAEDHDETHHVLRYAALATAITLAPNPQQEEPPKSNPAASADRNNSSALAERVAELEAELALVCAQLTEAEAALQAAEADIRDEVVGEIQVRCCVHSASRHRLCTCEGVTNYGTMFVFIFTNGRLCTLCQMFR